MRAMMLNIDFTVKRGLDGLLRISADGQPVVEIDDELWHQLMHLCRAIEELAAADASAVPYATMPGGYDLARDGDDIVISGDYLPSVRYPHGLFAAALLACVDRWLAHAQRVGGADHEGVEPLVREAAGRARTALASDGDLAGDPEPVGEEP